MRFIGEPVTEDEIEVCYNKRWAHYVKLEMGTLC